MEKIKTPVNPRALEYLLQLTNYDPVETEFLVDGFTNGFGIEYNGDTDVKMTSPNLKLEIGSRKELWNKVMAEVGKERYAGPFNDIPFQNYIQSPIGLVPKDNGKNTRLIFHLSYPRIKKGSNRKQTSVNANTPKEKCTVRYPDFSKAIALCMKWINAASNCTAGKTDLKSAFRHFPIKPEDWRWLVMMAIHPENNKKYYFVDKCMPFGASISCSHFQRFSNALAHIFRVITKNDTINYLDNFFFAAIAAALLNLQLDIFTGICDIIQFPWAPEKTVRSCTRIVFLGLLIDTLAKKIFIPTEKIKTALCLINTLLGRKRNKVTIGEVQRLTGLLNFFGRCIIPGRTFNRRLYALVDKHAILNKHHHIRLKNENKMDLLLWETFLKHPSAFSRDFCDLMDEEVEAIMLYTDASRNPNLGCGGHCYGAWFFMKWNKEFIVEKQPSIGYLELYAMTIGVVTWIHKFRNKKIAVFCDNMSVVNMINNKSSKCRNCMILMRIIVIHTLIYNVKLSATHVRTENNTISDSLSRLKFKRFAQATRHMKMDHESTKIPSSLEDMSKLWLN